MTPRQKIAFAKPCFEAEETATGEFHWRLPRPKGHFSAALTVNIGLE